MRSLVKELLVKRKNQHTYTPLSKFNHISDKYNCNVYGKLEIYNPTGSHKDRESQLIVEDTIQKGYSKVGCASTGNAAISLAAHALMKYVECHIWISKDICTEKLNIIKMFHPTIHIVDGNYHKAVLESNAFMKLKGIYNANPGVCILKLIGNSFIGLEILEFIHPDYIVCPTNNGSILKGVWLGSSIRNPNIKMVGATATNTKIASSIKGFHGIDKPAKVIEDSNGSLIDVSDEDIKEACQDLLFDGIIAEPASAASIASLKYLNLNEDQKVCCVITGNGMKYPQSLQQIFATEKK